MNENAETSVSQMQAVTISREYGSGGGEVAARLAERLHWQLVDHELIARVAGLMHVSEKEAEDFDECGEGFVSRIISRLHIIQQAMPVSMPYHQPQDPRLFHEAYQQVVEVALDSGPAVIVGRGAQVFLHDRRDVLHVRVIAPFEQRIRYVSWREGLDREAAQHRIQQKERDRERYMHEVYQCRPTDAHLYDLLVNTGVLDLESAVDVILLALQRKERTIGVKTGFLGPVIGLEPYPAAPGDLRPE